MLEFIVRLGNGFSVGAMASKKKRDELRSEASAFQSAPLESDSEASKKSPKRKIRRAKYPDTEVFDSATDVAEEIAPKVIKKKKKETSKKHAEIEQMFVLRNELVNAVMLIGKSDDAAKMILETAGKMEYLFNKTLGEMYMLKGEMAAYKTMDKPKIVEKVVLQEHNNVQVTGTFKKPVHTWSAVVKSKDGKESSEAIINKLNKEIGPTLDVRVHEVKPIKSGGAVVRTPSLAECKKIVNNPKFVDCGLSVEMNKKLGTKLKILGVETVISPEEFMDECYLRNFKNFMDKETFCSKIRLVTKPWTKGPGGTMVVTIEGSEEITEVLRKNGKCYIKWFSYHVREYEEVRSCFRCHGFDHQVAQCHFEEEVCGRCGKTGHKVHKCTNAINCRNCEHRGNPSGHLMMSTNCPIYSGILERIKSRH